MMAQTKITAWLDSQPPFESRLLKAGCRRVLQVVGRTARQIHV